MRISLAQVRLELARHLSVHRPEIEQTVRDRAFALGDPTSVSDPRYADGLRTAIGAAIDYGITGLECGEQRAAPPPPVLLAQARVAARHGISLDIVIRRYLAGYSVLGDYLISAVRRVQEVDDASVQSLLRDQAALFDRLVAEISEEYLREVRHRPVTPDEQRLHRVKRLLAGELIESSDLSYDFGLFHNTVIAKGPGVEAALRRIASVAELRLLLVRPGDGIVWAWFGGRKEIDPDWFERIAVPAWPLGAVLAIGEGTQGFNGWRMAYRQAAAAFPIAVRRSPAVARYAKVALLASMFGDDLLTTSLEQRYLVPLMIERDGGTVLRKTLRAYFAAGRNGASAAAALGVSRQTVSNRLETVEERLGHSLPSCATEVEAALCLEDVGRISGCSKTS